jgi:fructokinase
MIVVAGESLIDLIGGDGGTLVPLPGGAPFNVARGLARLEVRCAFLGAVSTDRFGALLVDALAADGVDLGHVVRTDRPTTLAVAELDRAGAARYRFYTEGTAAASLTPADARAVSGAAGVRGLHVGGLGLALEPLGDAVEQAVAAAGDDAIVTVDPNWRPDVLDDPTPWRRRLERVVARADVVKVSTEDLASLAPGVLPRVAAQELLRGRAACVLVTDGDRDVLVLTDEGEATVAPPRADVVDTVGAGDAFCAGFLAWCTMRRLRRDALGSLREMVEAARFAALVAARTCERPGADPPRLHELAGTAELAAAAVDG